MFPSPLSALDCQPWPRICGRRRAAPLSVTQTGMDIITDSEKMRAVTHFQTALNDL